MPGDAYDQPDTSWLHPSQGFMGLAFADIERAVRQCSNGENVTITYVRDCSKFGGPPIPGTIKVQVETGDPNGQED